MKLLHRTILRSWPGPFLAAFGTLMFLLLMQFLIKYLPDLVGRGLPALVVAELVAYSLAYMVTLAVPMAVLLATVLAFARLAETQAYAVTKSAGISLLRLAWPVVLLGVGLVAGMAHFNNVILPEANFRMKGLWQDIRQAKPGFQLEPGVFYDGIEGYALRVDDAPPESNELHGVLVFDFGSGGERATIVAERGALASVAGGDGLEMTLERGEIHRASTVRTEDGRAERYERVAFARHRLRFDLSDLTFERTGPETTSRSDRTMPTSQMVALVDSLDGSVRARQANLRRSLARLGRHGTLAPSPVAPLGRLVRPDTAGAPPAEGARAPFVLAGDDAAFADSARLRDSTRLAADSTAADSAAIPVRATLAGLDAAAQRAAYDLAAQRMRSVKAEIDGARNSLRWERQRADRYRVEIYKKWSMAVACVVFVLVGVPLGLAVRRGGLGLIATLAVGIFLFYWITLVQGEKLADRGLLQPWVGMWAANAIVGGLGLYLLLRENRDPADRDPLQRLFSRLRKANA